MKARNHIVYPILLAILLSGCSLFASHYDATRHENFTKLKAVHVKLFEDWTKGSNKKWAKSEITSYCDKGDLSFREAFEFAKSKDNADDTGQNSVKILWDEFGDNCDLLLTGQKLFSTVFKESILSEIEKNYGYAIAGELSRVNATQ